MTEREPDAWVVIGPEGDAYAGLSENGAWINARVDLVGTSERSRLEAEGWTCRPVYFDPPSLCGVREAVVEKKRSAGRAAERYIARVTNLVEATGDESRWPINENDRAATIQAAKEVAFAEVEMILDAAPSCPHKAVEDRARAEMERLRARSKK